MSVCLRSLLTLSVVALLGPSAAPARGAALTPGNILIIQGSNLIREVRPTGAAVQTFVLSNPAGPGPRTDTVRDAAVLPDGRLATFDGTGQPRLGLLDPVALTYGGPAILGWSTTNTLLGGGIATLGTAAFVTDMQTFGSPLEVLNGLIRYDTATGLAARFASGIDFIDVAVGGDRLVYGLPGGFFPAGVEVRVYDPGTLGLVRRVDLSGTGPDGVFAIAVNAAGEFFAGSGSPGSSVISRHAPDGRALGSLTLPGTGIVGLDLDGDGNLVAISADGRVFLTTEALATFAVIREVGGAPDLNVAFVPRLAGSAVPEPASAVLAALGFGALIAGSVRGKRSRPPARALPR